MPSLAPSGLRLMVEVDVFLIGAPKAGTTWLGHALNQHPGISLSYPKEPNIVASHKGTFLRVVDEPDWSKYEGCFRNEGLKLDASVHTFACPMSPQRIRERCPDARFILCLREPVSRTVSHWNMIRSNGADSENGTDWSDFQIAWSDERLRVDSMYGTSMERWLEHFDLKRFLVIDSSRLRGESLDVLRETEEFLHLDEAEYDLSPSRHSNSAATRRPMTGFGIFASRAFSLIPNIIKSPLVRYLHNRDLNIYNLPILSRRGSVFPLETSHYMTCGEELSNELDLFESLTGFETVAWKDEIRRRLDVQTGVSEH